MELTERRIKEAEYFIDKNTTMKETAKEFGVSMATIGYDFQKLEKIDIDLYKEVRKQLEENKKERSSRGGNATKRIWIEKGVVTGIKK